MTTVNKSADDRQAAALAIADMPEQYREVCEVIGLEKGLKLMKALGGNQLYIPRIRWIASRLNRRNIKKEFNGSNYKQLARKYGYSERWIRNIIKS